MDYFFYPYTKLTGGDAESLDSLDGSLLKNGDGAVVITTSGITYTYTLDEDSGASESSPNVISPDSNAGTKRWVLSDYGRPISTDVVKAEDFGVLSNGSDMKSAFDQMISDISSLKAVRIEFDTGTYVFNSKPANINKGVVLCGQGMSQTTFTRNYNASNNNEGFLTWSGNLSNGGGIERCQIRAGNGTTNGSMLVFTTGANDVCGYHYIDGVVVTYTNTGTYHRALLVDGVLNAVSGSQGLRDFNARRCFLFHGNTHSECCRFINATNLMSSDLWVNGTVVVTGGAGNNLTRTTDAKVNLTCLDQLYVSETVDSHFSGLVDTLVFSNNTIQCDFQGTVKTQVGGTSNFGNNSMIIAGAALPRSYAGNGYATLPGGLIIQWLKPTVGTSFGAYSFPIPFPTAVLRVTASASSASTQTIFCGTHSASNASLAASANNTNAEVIAIGY
jgi:hypothetical protein